MIDLNDKSTGTLTGYTEGIKDILSDALDKAYKPAEGETLPEGKAATAAKASSVIKRGEDSLNRQVLHRSSIISKARKSIMQFPIYITQSNRIAVAHSLGKAFERVYASFVQNVMAQNPVITDLSKVNNLKFLQDYHTNITESADITLQQFETIFNEYCEPIDQFDEILTEAVINELRLPGGKVTFLVARPNALLNQESARLATESLTGFRYLSEAGGPTRQTTVNHQSSNQDTSRTTDVVSSKPETVELTDDMIASEIDYYLKLLDIKDKSDDLDDNVDRVKEAIIDAGQKRTAGQIILQATNIAKSGNPVYKLTITRPNKQHSVDKNSAKNTATNVSTVKNDSMMPAVDAPAFIRDTDIKKFNGMQPYQFVVKFRVDPIYDTKKIDGHEVEVLRPGTNYEQSYILGVKTILHLIKTQDLVDDIREIITGDQKGLQKIRYKTGEISWLKDYLLNLKSLKADAMKRLDDRRWLNTLKRLGEFEKLNGTALKQPVNAIYKNGTPIPNATMILTRGDVERIKDETGIDLEKIGTARKLAKRLFLIAVVIVDQTASSFKVFFPDMDNDWDVQSIGALDSEVAKIDNSPLMAEINRLSRKG